MSQEQQEQQVTEVVAEVIHEEQQASAKRKRDEEYEEYTRKMDKEIEEHKRDLHARIEELNRRHDEERDFLRAEFRKLHKFTSSFWVSIGMLYKDLSEEAVLSHLVSYFPNTENGLQQAPLPLAVQTRWFITLHQRLDEMQSKLIQLLPSPPDHAEPNDDSVEPNDVPTVKIANAIGDCENAKSLIRAEYKKLNDFRFAFDSLIALLSSDISEHWVLYQTHYYFNPDRQYVPHSMEKFIFMSLHKTLNEMRMKLTQLFE